MKPIPVIALLGALLATAACDQVAPDQGPDPDKAADALAAGLARGDLAGIEIEGGVAPARAAYTEIVSGLGERGHTVTATDVQREGETATVTLRHEWDLLGTPWEYDAPATLTRAGDSWVVDWSPAVVEPSLEDGEALELDLLVPDRGDIIGARGEVLMTERPVRRIGVDKSRVPPARAVSLARQVASVTGVDAADYLQRVEGAGPKAFVEAIVYRQDDVPIPVARAVERVPGVVAVSDHLPLAPTRDFAAPILGRVGEVTEEIVQENPDRYRPGDQAGISGLQERYDEQLRGTPGLTVEAVGEGVRRSVFAVEPAPGEPLRLSLDARLQTAAERVLADVLPASALVALRPSSGDIVAAANGPGNDGLNLATFGQFAPGSTFKSVTSLALLRAGLTPASRVPCPRRIVVDGKPFTNYSDYPPSALGGIPLRTAVAQSCNTAFISQAGRAGGRALVDAAASLGFGVDHDLGFPAYFGSVAEPEGETAAAAQMIGQGTVLASPMAMAAVVGSVQAGKLVVPRMVDGVEVGPPDGVPPVTREEAAALRGLLRAVVTEGSGSALADVPGAPVIAKTGTAEFGSGDRLQTHAWMIAAQGDLAVAAFVQVGESGSRTAGPLVEAFLRAAR